jgi:hypothetical protein
MVLDGGTWDDETAKWGDPGQVTQVPYTSLTKRVKTVGPNGRPGTKPTTKVKDELNRTWPTLILDEAHYIKGRKTHWTEAIQPLAKRAGQVFLATGTPIVNWADELFVPLQVMYPEEAGPGGRFGSYWRWAGEWFHVGPKRSKSGKIVQEYHVGDLKACVPGCFNRPATDPCDHYLAFAQANLGERFLMRLRDEVLQDLPPLTEQTIQVPLRPKQATAYKQMKRDYLAYAEDGREVVAWSAGSREVMMDRITTGLSLVDLGEDSAKMERLAWDLQSRSRPTLVLAHYRDSVELAAKVAESVGARTAWIHGGVARGKQRTARVRDFQQGRIDVLVATLDTISEGLTFTMADQVIFVEKSFRPSRNQQAMRRVHRIGQERPVTVLDYVAVMPDGGRTVDVGKRETLATKVDRQVRHISAAQFAALL